MDPILAKSLMLIAAGCVVIIVGLIVDGHVLAVQIAYDAIKRRL